MAKIACQKRRNRERFFCGVDKNPAMVCFMRRIRTQIDQMVYKLYDLTPEEIAIVEGGIE